MCQQFGVLVYFDSSPHKEIHLNREILKYALFLKGKNCHPKVNVKAIFYLFQ